MNNFPWHMIPSFGDRPEDAGDWKGRVFPAKVTAVNPSLDYTHPLDGVLNLYTWTEQDFDPSDATFLDTVSPREGTAANGEFAVEMNDELFGTFPFYCWLRERGNVQGYTIYEFQMAPGGAGGGSFTFTDVTIEGDLTFTDPTFNIFGVVRFPETVDVNVAPDGRLVIPKVPGKPTYTGEDGEVLCQGKYIWQYDGTDWYGYPGIKDDYTPANKDVLFFDGTEWKPQPSKTLYDGETSDPAVAPTKQIVIPQFEFSGKPTYTGTDGEIACQGKYIWQYDGTDWYGYPGIKDDYTPAADDALVYDGTDWKPTPIEDVYDADTTSSGTPPAKTLKIPQFDFSGKPGWSGDPGEVGCSPDGKLWQWADDVGDWVSYPGIDGDETAADGDVLKYDNATGTWKPEPESGGTGSVKWYGYSITVVDVSGTKKFRVTNPDGTTTDTNCAAATTQTLTLTSPAGGTCINAFKRTVPTVFSGVAMLVAQVGYSGGDGAPTSDADVYSNGNINLLSADTRPSATGAATATNYGAQEVCPHQTSAWNLTLTFNSGTNLTSLSAGGSLKLWVMLGEAT